jgi:hypothetical protein
VRRLTVCFGMGLLFLILTAAHAPWLAAQETPIPHDSGQSISPSFEGWYRNSDGTYSLSFGYMNRNYAEEADVPVGANNKFSPGPDDRGQPTHFLPRRQVGIFAVVVPKDFADNKTNTLTWTLAVHGQTIAIPGHLRPEWEIDAMREATSGNTPPSIRFAPDGPVGQGPRGVSASMNVTLPAPATLQVWATDDGVSKSERAAPRSGVPPVSVAWSKFRGPGTVKFAADVLKVESGKATTTAMFSEPGEYVLRLHAWDESGRYAGGFQCCWTNGFMRVSASGSTAKSR